MTTKAREALAALADGGLQPLQSALHVAEVAVDLDELDALRRLLDWTAPGGRLLTRMSGQLTAATFDDDGLSGMLAAPNAQRLVKRLRKAGWL